MNLRHAYALLRRGESEADARHELDQTGLRFGEVFVDDIDTAVPRPGFRAAVAASANSVLVITGFDRIASGESELALLTATLVDHNITLDVGGTLVAAVNSEGRTLFDSFLQATMPIA